MVGKRLLIKLILCKFAPHFGVSLWQRFTLTRVNYCTVGDFEMT